MKQKQIISLIIATLLLIMTISFVSAANHKICMTRGQTLPNYKCEHDYCFVCINDNNWAVYDRNCPGDPVCGNTTIDTQPPALTINSPVNDQIYNTRSVLFSITTNELATLYYKYNADTRDNWKRIASKVTLYNYSISLKEGLNDITIKAVDMKGNENTTIKRFRVDYTKPKITKIAPAKGFASGRFDIWFTETNPKTLVLTYGNQVGGMKTSNVDLNQCTAIDPDKGKYNCIIVVPLSVYNGQNINYTFRLTDIANSYVDSKTILLDVDTSNPVFNNLGSMIKVNGKYVYFNMSVTEPNLLSVSYYDNSNSRPRWVKLCSSLKNGYCAKKVSFSVGNHIVDINAIDKAGNSASTSVEFNIA